MQLGSTSGVFIDFQDQHITALHAPRAQLQLDFQEFFDGALPQPFEDIHRYLHSEIEELEAPLIEEISVIQHLSCGTRKITLVNQYVTTLPGTSTKQLKVIESKLSFSFDLTQPIKWGIQMLPSTTLKEAKSDHLHFQLNKSSWISWNGSGAVWSDETACCSVNLPAGHTEITLSISIGGWRAIADTAVLCRPNQIREAAIVLSAIPDSRFIPLIVIEPSQTPLKEVSDLFHEYNTYVEGILHQSGTFGSEEFAEKSEEEQRQFHQDNEKRHQLLQALHPYRSWGKRNTILQNALVDFGIETVFCLFKYEPIDLALSGIEYLLEDQTITLENLSTFPSLLEGIHPIFLTSCLNGCSLDEVFQECHAIIPGASERPLLEIGSDLSSVILGLAKARQEGHSLRISSNATPKDPLKVHTYGTVNGNHVLAVEVADHAHLLTASLLAAHLETALFTLPKPNHTVALQHIERIQSAVLEYAATSIEHRGLWEDWRATFKKYLWGDNRDELFIDLEKEVTHQVPLEFIEAVGKHALTVFGSGLPYSFVRNHKEDWSKKPIGHIIVDPDLVIISELHRQGSIQPIVSFNVLIDPGFFQYSETALMEEALKNQHAHTLLLRNDTGKNFQQLANRIPLDFLFFNTHGADDTIMLGEYPLKNYAISQWFQFSYHPLIFNNSCLSWTGVGRDFIRVGARGYIGTLWSVAAKEAAQLAEYAMPRMLNDEPISSTILPTEYIDPFTSRAYIFVGVANATFSNAKPIKHEENSLYLIALIQNYFMLMGSAFEARAHSVLNYVYQEFKVLREKLIQRNEAWTKPFISNSLYAESKFLSKKSDGISTSVQYREALIEQAISLLDETKNSISKASQYSRCMAELLCERAEIYRLKGRFSNTLSDLDTALKLNEKNLHIARRVALTKIQIAIDQGHIDEAIHLAKQAELLTVDHEQKKNRAYELGALGRLCQALKRKSERLDEAEQIALRGISIAKETKYVREEAAFELDLAQILIQQNKLEEAKQAGLRSLAKSRRAIDTIGEVGAYGTLGQCCRKLNQLDQAKTYAKRGLVKAKELQESKRVVTFLNDLAEIEIQVGQIEASILYRTQAVTISATFTTIDRWQATIQMALESVSACSSLPDMIQFYVHIMSHAIGSVHHIKDETVLHSAGTFLVSIIVQLYMHAPVNSRLVLFQSILQSKNVLTKEGLDERSGENEDTGHSTTLKNTDAVSIHSGNNPWFSLLLLLCEMFYRAETGETLLAKQLAEALDKALNSQNTFTSMIHGLLKSY